MGSARRCDSHLWCSRRQRVHRPRGGSRRLGGHRLSWRRGGLSQGARSRQQQIQRDECRTKQLCHDQSCIHRMIVVIPARPRSKAAGSDLRERTGGMARTAADLTLEQIKKARIISDLRAARVFQTACRVKASLRDGTLVRTRRMVRLPEVSARDTSRRRIEPATIGPAPGRFPRPCCQRIVALAPAMPHARPAGRCCARIFRVLADLAGDAAGPTLSGRGRSQ